MIRFLKSRSRRFARDEDGSATIEFSILFMPVMLLLASAAELGMVNVHYSTLERAVDMTVRDIRLGTGSAPQHADIRSSICSRADFIKDCNQNLKIEMIRLDPFAWTNPPTIPDCTDQSLPVAPVRNFQNGAENDLMFLRVCAKFDPMFPTIGIGKNIQKDGSGMYKLVTVSAFVQEPL